MINLLRNGIDGWFLAVCYSRQTGAQKRPVLPLAACAVTTASKQSNPDAEPKTGVSAINYRSRSSRDGIPSSSNLKNKSRSNS
jgi:hypothetical protein